MCSALFFSQNLNTHLPPSRLPFTFNNFVVPFFFVVVILFFRNRFGTMRCIITSQTQNMHGIHEYNVRDSSFQSLYFVCIAVHHTVECTMRAYPHINHAAHENGGRSVYIFFLLLIWLFYSLFFWTAQQQKIWNKSIAVHRIRMYYLYCKNKKK